MVDTRNALDTMVAQSMRIEPPTRAQALSVLSDEHDVFDVVAAAFRVRRHFFGRRVKLNSLINVKSGMCPEDCFYCSQRKGSAADIMKYSWISPDEMAALAQRATDAGAKRICLVGSGRGPRQRDIDRVAQGIDAVKSACPDVEICVCLGLLSDGQAEQLQQAGAFAYNHNLNTSEQRYADICTTHTFADRVDTVRRSTKAGLSPCSGAIFGMGESNEEIVDVAIALRELDPDSVPVNFLIPFDGTPLARHWELTPQRCLRILALFRFFFPNVEVRLAGGREIHLRSLQPLALHIANSIFLGDYLTSEGQPGEDDRRMITDAGFTIEGMREHTLPEARHDLVTARRRGAGTELPANV